MKGTCVVGKCQPAVLAIIEAEWGVELGLSPEFVLVAALGYAPIYTVGKSSGEVKLTRPDRNDSSRAVRLWGTDSTLVTIDLFSGANNAQYLGHCTLTGCSDSDPPANSFTLNNIWDFAFDTASSRVYWYDPTTRELTATNADAWVPSSLGAITKFEGPNDLFPKSMTFGSGRVYGAFEYSIDAISVEGSSAPVTVSDYPSAEDGVQYTAELIATTSSLVLLYPTSGNIYRVPLPGGIGNREPDKVQGPTEAANMAVVGERLFWSGTTTVTGCTLPACTDLATIATDDAIIEALAADEVAIYWLSRYTEGGATTTLLKRLAR